MDDLRWLRQSGLEAAVQKLHARRTPILGICGGYQMLGRRLEDPCGTEGGGTLEGMGLLPVETRFAPNKTRLQVSGAAGPLTGIFEPLSHCPVEGYELHMGVDEYELFTCGDTVLGTYLHGLFDTPQWTEGLVALLLARKGEAYDPDRGALSARDYREQQYDKLAQRLRESLNMELIYEILEKGVPD